MNDNEAVALPDVGDQTIAALLHAAHALEDRLETALSRAGLSSPKFSILGELVKAGTPLPLSELASRLSCVRSNITQLVDRMETDGLVRRVDCPTDRRSVKAEITDEGRARYGSGAIEVSRVEDAFRASMSTTDRAALGRMLSALG
jgi:DNA-binding MarR family transcriptional regulator